MNVLRKPTTQNAVIPFEFEYPATKVVIKNFSGGNIHVSDSETVDEFKAVRIPHNVGQEVVFPGSRTIYVKASTTSSVGVEVQPIEY